MVGMNKQVLVHGPLVIEQHCACFIVLRQMRRQTPNRSRQKGIRKAHQHTDRLFCVYIYLRNIHISCGFADNHKSSVY